MLTDPDNLYIISGTSTLFGTVYRSEDFKLSILDCRHPNTSERPGFTEITRQLSLPDPKLLKWSQEDKLVHPEAAELEADLLCAQDLYKDLQNRYIKE